MQTEPNIITRPVPNPFERTGLTIHELRAELAARGFTAVQTMGGNIPLDTFDPYGFEGVNRAPGRYRGEIIERDGKTYIRDTPLDNFAPGGFFVLGAFHVVRS